MKYDFDMIALGGGAAGLGISGIAANLGAKACMIESHRLGGDCTWTGCIPSKTLLKASKVAHQIREAGRYGLIDSNPAIDFVKVMEYVDQVRNEVYHEADAPEIFEAMGVEVKTGKGTFLDAHTLKLTKPDGQTEEISSRYITVCTGSEAFVPPIPGLDSIPFWTNESLFEIRNLPNRLLIVGAGPIGIEMAQAFGRLGSQVTVVEVADRIMSRDNEELTGLLMKMLEKEGIQFRLGTGIQRFETSQNNETVARVVKGETTSELIFDGVLIAAGRRPRVLGLGLENAGVTFSARGIATSARCRTNVTHIYAAGDVLGGAQFTHMAEHTAKIAISNALLKIPARIDHKRIPWTTFTDPELAHLGASEVALNRSGKAYATYRFPYSKIDRAIADSDSEGWIKVYATKGAGKILGVDILGARAGDLIGEFALAMKNGISLRRFSDTIHPYPTYTLGARRAADQWYVRKQAAWQIKLLQKVFGYRGKLPDLSDPERIV